MTATLAPIHFREVIEAHINGTVLGDPLEYDLAAAMVPHPQTGQGVVAYVLVISCRSPVLSPPRIAIAEIIFDAHPGDEQLTAAVDKSVARLFVVRRQLLSGQVN